MRVEQSYKSIFGERPKFGKLQELTSQEWVESLTKEENFAIQVWGRMGSNLRKVQSGNTAGMTAQEITKAKKILPHWESAMAKGVKFDGTIYRGLSNVPYEGGIDEWINKGIIELTNDQSASYDLDVGKSFAAHKGHGNNNSVFWEVSQSNGVDLLGKTNVTMGGKFVSESEIVMRKGTQYRIKSADFIRNDKIFPSPDYFEGTDFSWPDNPPPNWYPGKSEAGYWLIKLSEVLS